MSQLMKNLVTIVILLVVTNVKSSNLDRFTSVTLSDSAKISLITCGDGEEVYSHFGHSAIRVRDNNSNIDLAFNYGTFDPTAPNFLPKFIQGELNYFLSVYPYSYFEPSYVEENRWVKEEVLLLDNKEVNSFFQALILNAQGKNRYYRYYFFNDNCATRVRDIIINSIPGISLSKDSLFVNRSLRDEMNKHLGSSPWTKFGLNIALGSRIDNSVNNWTSMFMPDNVSLQLSKASIKHKESPQTLVHLLAPERFLVNSYPIKSIGVVFSPIVVILLLLLLSIGGQFFYTNSTVFVIMDYILWIALGLVGLLLFYFSFISLHTICKDNFNLLWISPFYLLYLIPTKSKAGTYLHLYLSYGVLLLLVLFIISALFGFQRFPIEAFVMVALIASRIIRKIPFFISSRKLN